MIANIITIKKKSLLENYKVYEITFGEPIHKLIQEILDMENGDVCIRIHKNYLPKSYHKNPALYKRQIQNRWPRKIMSSYGDGDYIVVCRADYRYSNCFTTRVFNAIREHDTLHALKGSIPAIYLTEPRRLARILEKKFLCRFAIIAKPKSITWSRKISHLDKLNSW